MFKETRAHVGVRIHLPSSLVAIITYLARFCRQGHQYFGILQVMLSALFHFPTSPKVSVPMQIHTPLVRNPSQHILISQ